MELNDLKLFALFYIMEQDLSKKDQIHLMNFIEGAGSDEIIFLLATGQVPLEENFMIREVDGQAYRLESFSHKRLQAAGDVGHKLSKAHMYFGTAISGMATSIAFKINKEKMAQLAGKCENEKGTARKACYNMIRRDAIRAEILALSSMKSKCHKSKTAETCIKNIDNRMKKLQQRMDAIKVST